MPADSVCPRPIADVDVRCDADLMIALLAMLFIQAAPPPPPSERNMAAPVLAFWRDQAISDAERRDLRDAGRSLLANELLDRAAEDWSRRPAFRQEKLKAMIDRLRILSPYTSKNEEESADLCAAGTLVGSLSPPEIAEAQAFFQTPAGRRFWSSSRIGADRLVDCYKIGMRGSIDAGAALRSVGVRPPAAWGGPPID
jgi:hypothetical protein